MKSKKLFISAILFSIALFVLCEPVLAATYFVKPDGNDGNDGRSDATAWRTASKVNSFNFSTGDDVYFKSGGSWKGNLLINWSGTEQNRVKVGAYYVKNGTEVIGVSGNKPILDGAHQVPNDSYEGLVLIRGHYADFMDFRVINSEGHGVQVVKGFSNVVKNVETHDTYRSGIQFHSSDTGTAENNVVHNAAMVWPECAYQCDWPSNLASITSRNITIRGNLVYESYGEGIGLFHESSDSLVEGNLIYSSRGAGIYIDGSWNNIVRRNMVYGTTDKRYHRSDYNGFGLGVNDENWRPRTKSANNAFYHNLVAFTKNGMWIATQHVDAVFNDSEIYSNTFVGNETTFFVPNGPWENSYVKNNISVIIAGGRHYVGPQSTPGLVWDHNNWSSLPEAAVRGSNDIIADPRLYKNTGWTSIAPGSLKPIDFSLTKDSPSIDAGADLGNNDYRYALLPINEWSESALNTNLIDQEHDGRSWDIGAIVYSYNTSTNTAPQPPFLQVLK